MAADTGLMTYLLLARRPRGMPVPPAPADGPARPGGPLIWLHAEGLTAAEVTVNLIAALHDAGCTAGCLATLPPEAGAVPDDWQAALGRACGGVLCTALAPVDTAAAARGFVDHWRPDVAAFVGGGVRPWLVHAADQQRVPMILLDAPSPRLAHVAPGLVPGVIRATLARFERIGARSAGVARDLRRFGVPADRLTITGPLQEGPGPLPCTEAERAALAHLLHGRPTWLAAGVPEAEAGTIVAAHLRAQRHSHRLLLILVPAEPGRGAALAEALSGTFGIRIARRNAEDDLEDEVSVYLADTEEELGLWLRLAPITFLGGTFSGGAFGGLPDGRTDLPAHDGRGVVHPFAAAALGSVVLHGPAVPRRLRGAIDDLAAAQAARVVRGADGLAEAIGDLLAPDRAASMAHNAWEVTSARDEATAAAARLVCDRLAAAAGGTGRGPVR